MPANAVYARESDCKDTLKKVNINILRLFFALVSNIFILYNSAANKVIYIPTEAGLPILEAKGE